MDEDARFSASLVALARDAGYEAVSTTCGEDALALAREEVPDVVVVAVELPGLSGYEVCRRLKESHDAIGIVLVSATRTESLDRAAGLLIGADDYLAKPFAPDELLARIRCLLRNGSGRSSGRPARAAGGNGLTAREHEVLALLAGGGSQKDIAAELVISPKTVAAHIDHIRHKLGVHSRAQAVAVAYRDGHLSQS